MSEIALAHSSAADRDATQLEIGRAWRDLRRLRAVHTVTRPLLDPPLEISEIDALDVVGNSGGAKMQAIAQELRIDPSTATRAVERLERRGLVERSRLASDGRFVVARPTPEGIALHQRLRERRLQLLSAVLDRLDPDERDQLALVLPRFAAAVTAVLDEGELA